MPGKRRRWCPLITSLGVRCSAKVAAAVAVAQLLAAAAAVVPWGQTQKSIWFNYAFACNWNISRLPSTAAIRVPSAAYQATMPGGSIGQLVNGGATDLFGRYAHLAGFRGSSSTSCLSFGWWAIIICLKNDRLAYGMLRRGLTSLTMHICIWLAAAAAAKKKPTKT